MNIPLDIQSLPESFKNALKQRYLYRYRKLNTYFEEILTKNQLHFANLKDLNDPFEGKAEIDSNNSELEIQEFLINDQFEKIINQKSTEFKTREELKWVAERMINMPITFQRIGEETINSQIDKCFVCCFSNTVDNKLLWSHYADEHKGVCLKFDVKEDEDFFAFLLQVIYQENRPIYNHINEALNFIDKIIATKSIDWKYEEEYRIWKGERGPHKFKKNALVEIVFGCRTSIGDIMKIKGLAIKNGFSHLVFKQARLKNNGYGLEFMNV
ncbi:MAG TPA: DUF2971 domain-containing protein [Saprospiraceae bacterium]|nr:DUF2971 domain-containing protein [Saprospiraceae bacterium]